MNSNRVTMQDVAKRAGVSMMTVSRALRGDSGISEATRMRIFKLSKQMGYKKDPLLSALVSYRSKKTPSHCILGYIDDFRKRDGSPKTGAHAEFFQGALERTEEIGYKLDYIELIKPGITPRRATQILKARNIQGIILAPRPRPRAHMHLEWGNFSVVTLGHTLRHPAFHSVMMDFYQAMILAVRKLRGLGYRKIGLAVNFLRSARENHLYLAGYLVEQMRFKPEERIPPYFWNVFNEKKGFDRWFARYSPQAIIHTNDIVPKHLFEMGVKVPETVGLACFGKLERYPSWSGIDSPSREVGRRAVDFLLELIRKGERGVPVRKENLSIECSWRKGETLRRIN